MIAFAVLLCVLLTPVQQDIVTRLDVGAVASAEAGSLAWSPDSDSLVLGLSNGEIMVWSFEDDSISWLRKLHGYAVYDISWSLNDQYIAWVTDTDIALYDTQLSAFSYFRGGHTEIVSRIAFSPDGYLLASAANAERAVIVWDVETGRPLHKLELDEGHFPFSIAFSPDSSVLAVGQFLGSIELWDIESGKQLSTLTGLNREVVSIVWAPNGRKLAASSSCQFGSSEGEYDPYLTIGAWDIESGELIYALEGSPTSDKPYGVYKIAVSPNGEWLASSTMSGEIRVWDFESGEMLDTLDGHTDYIFDLAWSPDGQMLASVSADNTVIVWDNPLDASD